MKLNELSPAAGSTKEAYRKGQGSGSGNAQRPAVVTRPEGPLRRRHPHWL